MRFYLRRTCILFSLHVHFISVTRAFHLRRTCVFSRITRVTWLYFSSTTPHPGVEMGTCKMQESKKLDERFRIYQEPIIRSFHLPRLPSESTLSRIFLFLEAPPTGFFVGVYTIANHMRAVVLYCLCHMQATRKYFNNGEKRGNFTIFFLGVVRTPACFRGKLKNPPRISVLKNKKIRDRVDSRVQLVWRLRVLGSCVYIYLPNVSIRSAVKKEVVVPPVLSCYLHQDILPQD